MEMLDRGDRLFYKKYFSDAGEFADLVQAIVIYEDAIGEHDLSDAKCAIEDLRKALKFGKGARRLVPRDDPDRGDTLRELAEVHRYPYLCTGRIGSLHEVVETLEDALALMLHERFKVHNNEDDIRAAEGRIAQAIELASGDQNRLKAFLKTYADILKAVLRVQKAIESKDLCAGDPMNFHQACSLVGVLYKLKFARSQRDEHFNDALVYLRLARESAPVGSEYHAQTLTRIAVTMGDLYNQTGKAELLEEAIASARQAILSVPERHYSIYEMRTNLGALLLDRCKSGGKADHAESGDAGIEASRLADLNEAIGYFEQSLEAVHSTRLAWGPQAFGLSFMLSYRAQLTGETSSLPTAFKLLLMSVENEAESHFDRISMASRALRYIFERQQRNRGVARQTGQRSPADTCSFSLKLDNVEEALQRVEYGRGLILGHLIDRKDDITGLKEKHVDLGKRYLDLRDREIRRQPGFENFQEPTSLEELQWCATHGPIVVVNVTSLSSDAVILTKSKVATIPLPE
ncbi:hypothetical protein IWX48DRAFT_683897 [Phyllosticta citricarpa]